MQKKKVFGVFVLFSDPGANILPSIESLACTIDFCVFVVKFSIREQGRVSRSDVAHPGREIWAPLSTKNKQKSFFFHLVRKLQNCSRELHAKFHLSQQRITPSELIKKISQKFSMLLIIVCEYCLHIITIWDEISRFFLLIITTTFLIKNNNQLVVSDSKLDWGNLQSLEILETNRFDYATMMNFRIWFFFLSTDDRARDGTERKTWVNKHLIEDMWFPWNHQYIYRWNCCE